MHKAIMVMGVSGAGKSTIAQGLATVLGGVYLDGDDYHPQSNVDHMAAGRPLTDDMRWPWLDILGATVNASRADHVTVFACSALKRSYRDHLRAAIPDLQIAYLDAPYEVVSARMAARENHYMPTSLLDSQFAVLEVPQMPAMSVSIDQPVPDIIAALAVLG
ncbi:gluconokinase [Loktanella sp. D2R18]|uniref:gluconokinase n=1 Tax=Rhodobacterales TaxID=204455 RepID=UPI000DEBF324|nr:MULTISPECIES: gluconokinase [Rhodobacterales]MDO6590966.1 gluconokinase [Yoonia sp. 1_MG-2023]RBW42268.1 gluconokinase [Loktanella sp. D2R18]